MGKNLILASGNLGSTLQAAKTLSLFLDGETDVLDTADDPVIDFAAYSNVIFGANVRMFKINKRFLKYAKKLKKSKCNARIFGYIIAADAGKSVKYIEKMKQKLGNDVEVIYAGALFDESNAAGFVKKVVENMKASYIKEGKALPEINAGALKLFAERISAT